MNPMDAPIISLIVNYPLNYILDIVYYQSAPVFAKAPKTRMHYLLSPPATPEPKLNQETYRHNNKQEYR